MVQKRGSPTVAEAEAIAIDALGWLASEPEALGRFLALSGIDEKSLRSAAADSAFLGGILDYFVSEEALLISYATSSGSKPEHVVAARRVLGSED